jgi:hypothetical protein
VKKILITITILIVVGGGIYAYINHFQGTVLTAWSFVPAEAIAVYHSRNPLKQWEESKEKKIWKNLKTLPVLKKVDEYLTALDSLSGKNGSIQSFFEKNQMLFSFHTVSRNSVDILFSVEVKGLREHELLDEIIEWFKDSAEFSQKDRQYLGHTITELNSNNSSFAYVFHKGIFVGSFTPFLVEDAIRVIEEEEVLSFPEQHPEIFQITRLEQDQGDIYINTRKLDQITGVFTDPLKTEHIDLSSLSEVSFLDLSITDENILMTGFSLNSPTKANYLSTFNGVSSSEFEMLEVIPNNTAALFHYSFDDPEKWHSDLKNYWRKTNPSLLTKMGELENKYDISNSDLYDFLGTEIGLMVMESVNVDNPDLLACIKVSDASEAHKFLEALSNSKGGEEKYDESWADIKLGQIGIDDIPARLFGPVFSGFSSTFYCQIGDFILFGNNEQILKELIDNINSEETWRKSINVNNFLNVANREANLSLFINTPGAWNFIDKYLNENWKMFFNEHAFTLKQIEFVAFQFSNVDGKYYTNIALQHPGDIIERVETSEFETISEIEFSDRLTSKPYIVRNHIDKSLEMIVQDSLNRIHLVSSKIDVLWNKEIDEKIKTPVYQVDYYKNKKLQYLFATDSSIYIIDRTGENIPGYPYQLPENNKIKLLSLIDYDNSRKYRVIGATEAGQYYLFDKNGVNLEGWKPKKLEGSPVVEPFHMRVRSRDYIMFMHQNGLVYVLNRRGEPVKGFPLDLKGKTDNPLFIQKGGNISDTKFTALTNQGELVEFNLEGKFLRREQIFKSTSHDKFKMVISSPNQKTYLILRSDRQKVSVIDSKGNELFHHNIATPSLNGKFYNFSPDNQVVILTDMEKEYTYLYDQEGKVLHALPLETGEEIAMQYFNSTGAYKIYRTYNNKLSVLNLKR